MGFQIEYNTLEKLTACGGIFSNLSGMLSSPSYPDQYPELTDCIFLISQPDETYVSIIFNNVDISCQGTSSDFVELRDGKSELAPVMGRFCGNSTNVPPTMQTTQNYLRIRWRRIYVHEMIPAINGFSSPDSSLTTFQVALGFNLNTNPQMCPNGLITLVHVGATSQPRMGP